MRAAAGISLIAPWCWVLSWLRPTKARRSSNTLLFKSERKICNREYKQVTNLKTKSGTGEKKMTETNQKTTTQHCLGKHCSNLIAEKRKDFFFCPTNLPYFFNICCCCLKQRFYSIFIGHNQNVYKHTNMDIIEKPEKAGMCIHTQTKMFTGMLTQPDEHTDKTYIMT